VKITVVNFQKSEVGLYARLVKDIVSQEFSELNHSFDELRIFMGNSDDIRNGLYMKQVEVFLGYTEAVGFGGEVFELRSCANPPKALIGINLSIFETYEKWKQKLSIRHECCHLLHFEREPEEFTRLLKNYPENFLNVLLHFQHEYCAHFCVIHRCPDDWVIEPVGFSKTIQSPSVLYHMTKANKGTKAAFQVSIQNIIHLLSILYLYESLPTGLKSKVKKKKKVATVHLAKFLQAMKTDLRIVLPVPEKWLAPEDFLSSKAYIEKVQKILALVSC